MKIKLRQPINHKGQEIHELNIPVENLTGQDIISIEEFLRRTTGTFVTVFQSNYIINVVSKAAKIPVEVLNTMKARDFLNVVTQVQNFLVVSDSATDETEQEKIPVPNPEILYEESQSG